MAPRHWTVGICIAAVTALLVALGARAEEPEPPAPEPRVAYHWVDADGTYCWADSLEGVPRAYHAHATPMVLKGLDNFERFTPIKGD